MNITISGLSKSFSYKVIHKDFSLKIKSGESIGIYGPNGCGKTTLLKIISGIMSFESGKVLIGKEVLKSNNSKSRENTFYLGHSNGLYNNLTAQENLIFIAKLYNKNISNINTVLSSIGLNLEKKKLISFFSKGMLQRLKIGACIVSDCKILLLDEPISGLDEDGIRIFSGFYDDWRKLKRTILLVSHDLEWLKNKTDRILKFN